MKTEIFGQSDEKSFKRDIWQYVEKLVVTLNFLLFCELRGPAE